MAGLDCYSGFADPPIGIICFLILKSVTKAVPGGFF